MIQYTDFVNPNLRFLGEVIRIANRADLEAERAAPKRINIENPPPLVPEFDETTAEKFREYRPSYEVNGELKKTRLQRITVSPRTGDTVAYYDLRLCNPATGQEETVAFLYGIRNGEFVELKKFDPRPWRGR